jgi:hypothetical protein
MTKDEALRLALEAMKIKQHVTMWANDGDRAKFNKAIKAVEAALLSRSDGEAKDEPVAYIRVSKTGNVMACAKSGDFYALPDKTLLYTTPPQRKPLTDEEIRRANHHMVDGAYDYSFKQGVKWAEYKHGIKGEA